MNEIQAKLYSVTEAAALLGMSGDSVRKHIREGNIQGVRIGRTYRAPGVELARLTGVEVAS